jgi:protein-tyrosine phosphatase
LGIPEGENGEKAYQYVVNEMIKAIENKQRLLIHCKAGIGRTGTIAATV